MTTTERTDLIKLLQTSEAALLEKIQVNEDLFLFKPTPETWSMAELVEHLIITDTSLLNAILKKGERLYTEMPPTFPNEKLRRAIGNRNNKITAPSYLIPQGIFKNKETAIAAFRANRAKIEDFIMTTELPLAKIAFPHFVLGLIDGKGWVTFMAGHCERHSEQIGELVEVWNAREEQ